MRRRDDSHEATRAGLARSIVGLFIVVTVATVAMIAAHRALGLSADDVKVIGGVFVAVAALVTTVLRFYFRGVVR